MAARARLVANRHGRLAVRFHWQGKPFWEGTGLADTPENRATLEPVCAALAGELERDQFDGRRYLHYFPGGNKAAAFLQVAESATAAAPALRDYAAEWLERKQGERMRSSTWSTYHNQLRTYVLDARLDDGTCFGNLRMDEITTRRLMQLKTLLLRRVKGATARAVIGGVLRTVCNAARAEELIERDPYANLQRWEAEQVPAPTPFNPSERDAILAWFHDRRRHHWPLVATLFYTGCRPSEAVALRWGNVDLARRRLSITASRVDRQEGAPKTTGSRRTIDMSASLVEVLTTIYPLRPDPTAHVFTERPGSKQAVEQRCLGRADWATCLRSLELPARGLYCCRDTFLSIGVSRGMPMKRLGEYCGTSARMIERHYALYLPEAAPGDLEMLNAAAGPCNVTTSARSSS